MGVEENKAVVRRMYDHINRREFDEYYPLLNPECVFHSTERDIDYTMNKEFDAMFFKAFPDMTITIEKMVAEGDMVAIRIIGKGTHQSDFMGAVSTGKKVEFANTHIIRIADGRIAEGWSTTEFPLLMQQLGVSPPGQ